MNSITRLHTTAMLCAAVCTPIARAHAASPANPNPNFIASLAKLP